MFFPKYIYAVEWSEENINYVQFFTERKEVILFLSQVGAKTFFLMQHGSTFEPNYLHKSMSYNTLGLDVNNEPNSKAIVSNLAHERTKFHSWMECMNWSRKKPYHYVYSLFRYNEILPSVVPQQEWLERKIDFLYNRQIQNKKPYSIAVKPKEKVIPKLFFAMKYSAGILSCELDTVSIESNDTGFILVRSEATGFITWKKQILTWRNICE